MRIYLGIVGLMASIFVLEMGWVFMADPGAFWPSIQSILADPWGALTVFDLSLGLLLLSGIIYAAETSKTRAVFWILSLWCLGNPASAAYVLLNYRSIWARLNPDSEPLGLSRFVAHS